MSAGQRVMVLLCTLSALYGAVRLATGVEGVAAVLATISVLAGTTGLTALALNNRERNR